MPHTLVRDSHGRLHVVVVDHKTTVSMHVVGPMKEITYVREDGHVFLHSFEPAVSRPREADIILKPSPAPLRDVGARRLGFLPLCQDDFHREVPNPRNFVDPGEW